MPSAIDGGASSRCATRTKPIRQPSAHELGERVERRVRLLRAAAVIDEQDRARHAAIAVSGRAGERLREVVAEVVGVLDADREPHDGLGDALGALLFGREGARGSSVHG